MEKGLQRATMASINNAHKVTQYLILHRLYYTRNHWQKNLNICLFENWLATSWVYAFVCSLSSNTLILARDKRDDLSDFEL